MAKSAEPKRTFKEKLRHMISEAEIAQAQTIRDQQLQNARSLCIDLLVNGFPSAFCEFHKLATNASHGKQDDSAAPGSSAPELSLEVMRLVHMQLINAESALTSGDRFQEFDAYIQLGLYFEQAGSLDLAAYYYKQCLAIAEAIGWVDGRMATHLALGLVMRNQGLIEDSLKHHMDHLRLADEAERKDESDVAHQNLVQVYGKLAENAPTSEAGFAALQKCLQSAVACADVASQGTAYHLMGILAQKEGDFREALSFQKQFLSLSSQGANKAAVARAYFSIAECHEAVDDMDAAVVALETYMDMLKLSSPAANARACCKFGGMYFDMGKYSQAVMYFEKFFEVARSMGDMRVLDVARFNLGVARGTACQAEYLGVVDSDLLKLLNWKNLRIPFTDAL